MVGSARTMVRELRPQGSNGSSGESRRPLSRSTIALDLVNTVACERCRNGDGLSDSAATSRWIAAHPEFVPALRRTLPIKELRDLRESLRSVFATNSSGDPPNPRALDCINHWSQAAPQFRAMSWKRGSMKVDDITEADPRVSLLAAIARSGMELAEDRSRDRVRPCQAPGCLHYLISRNSVQLWCSPTGCGNRVRVSRHYTKKREAIQGSRGGSSHSERKRRSGATSRD